VIVAPEARLGFWSIAYLVLLHRGKDPITAAEMADTALEEFEDKAATIEKERT